MVSVLCMDVEPETMALLQRRRHPPILHEADNAAHLIAALRHDPTATEAVVLGKGVDDPLRLVHYVHAVDQDLAVLLLAGTEATEHLREALGFVPSLLGDVSCASPGDADALSVAIEEAARRTQKRRILRAMNRAGSERPEEAPIEAPLTATFLVQLLDHAPVGIVVLNAHGRVQLANPSAVDLLAMPEKELIGRSFVLLFAESDWEALSHHLARCSATERRIAAAVFRCASPPECARSLELTAAPFAGVKGARGTLVFLENRTDAVADERRAAWPDRRAHDADRLAALAGFSGEVAQRFQGQLAPMVDNVEVLLKNALDPTTAALLARIRDEGRRAADLADQLLTFAGHKLLRLEPVDLGAVVRSALASLEESVPTRIAVGVNLRPDLPTVIADSDHVRSIVKHLVVQAADAIGHHSGQIDVSTGVADAQPARLLPWGTDFEPPVGPCVYLEVADDARDREVASRLGLFDRRAAERRAGVNIALAAVVGAARSQGSSIEVGASPKGGAAFRVLFPLHAAPPPRSRVETPASGALLLFSHEQNTLSVTKRILEHHGLTAVTAGSSDEALAILRSPDRPIDALLLDADAAEPAPELLAELDRLRATLPVILSGSTVERGEVPESVLRPAAFLLKPFTVEVLMRTVRSVLSDRHKGSAASSDP